MSELNDAIDASKIKIRFECQDSDGKWHSTNLELGKGSFKLVRSRDITDEHLEMLRQGKDVEVNARFDLKVEFTTVIKSEDQQKTGLIMRGI